MGIAAPNSPIFDCRGYPKTSTQKHPHQSTQNGPFQGAISRISDAFIAPSQPYYEHAVTHLPPSSSDAPSELLASPSWPSSSAMNSTELKNENVSRETFVASFSHYIAGSWLLYGVKSDQPDGIHAFTSSDFRLWHDAGRILSARDVPWVTGSLGRPVHPAVLQFDGKTYLFFEVNGQIGVAWSPSPTGPFTVRRTPIINQRKWGKAFDPNVLSLPVSVDQFGTITPASPATSASTPANTDTVSDDQSVRTDWLVWGGNAITLCTLGEDRMELAFGMHRSRVIRWAPTLQMFHVKHSLSDQADSSNPVTHQTGQAQSGDKNVLVSSPQIFQLNGMLYALWCSNNTVFYASADRLTGPWGNAGIVLTVLTRSDRSTAQDDQTSLLVGERVDRISVCALSNESALLTVSGQHGTRVFMLAADASGRLRRA